MPMAKRKRQRIVLVCNNCKQRKKKCDRMSPCTSCKLSDLVSSCHYEYGNSSEIMNYMISANNPVNFMKNKDENLACEIYNKKIKKPKLEKSLIKIFPIIENKNDNKTKNNTTKCYLNKASNQEIKKLDSSSKVELSLGNYNAQEETTKSILLNKDKSSADLFCKIYNKSDYRTLIGINPFSNPGKIINFFSSMDTDKYHGTLSWTSLMLKDPALKILWKTVQLNADIKGYNIFQMASKSLTSDYLDSTSHKISSIGGQNTLSITKEVFLNTILEILPSKNIICDLVDHFFLEVYPFMPFLDERFFKSQVFRIVSHQPEEDKFSKINIYTGYDYAYLGLLLVVLKLSYLSLFSNISSNSNNIQIKSFDEFNNNDNPILSSKFIQYALICIEYAENANSDVFPVFLLAFFIKLYKKYAPEDNEIGEGNEAQKLNLYIINKAINMGLNQVCESSVLHNLDIDHLKNKIWFFLIFADLSQGYTYGYDKYISMSKENMIPSFDLDCSNLYNKEMDQQVTNFFFKCSILTQPLNDLLKLILCKEGSKLSEICQVLNEFESVLDDDIGSFETCFVLQKTDCPLENFKRLFTIKYHLSFDVFLINLYWHLYLHFELIDINMSYFYLKKSLLLILEIYPYCHQLLNNSSHPCDYIINPSLEKFINKANQILLSFLIRVDFSIYSFYKEGNVSNEFSNYIIILEQIRDQLIEKIQSLILSLSGLAEVYNNARHIVKTYECFLKLRSKSNIFENNCRVKGSLVNFQFSYRQSLELIEILRSISQASEDVIDTTSMNFDTDIIDPSFDDLAINLEYDFDRTGSFFDSFLSA